MAADALQRWTYSLQALQTTIGMQAQGAQNLASDENSLATLVQQSQGAVGILQAAQATNQLLALQSRQSIQEQQLRLTQDRSAALEQARAVAAEARIARSAPAVSWATARNTRRSRSTSTGSDVTATLAC